MNTRMFWTPGGWWFGGGSDLNPAIEDEADTAAFHAALKAACDAHDPGYYPRFKAWADEYFLIRHRGEPRGVGGIFYDDLCTGDWEADFAFTRDVGRAFLAAFVPITERHMARALDRGGARDPAGQARPLCRVQPGLRPRHEVRAGDRPQRRGGADVAAAGREVALSRGVPPRAAVAAIMCSQVRALSSLLVFRLLTENDCSPVSRPYEACSGTRRPRGPAARRRRG